MSTRNITNAARLASPKDWEDGLGWYASAMALARSLDPEHPEQAAGVIAVLSPMTSWPVNVRLAKAVYEGETPKCLSKNADKAVAIFRGKAAHEVVSGVKVKAFFANIIGDDSDDAVTLDRHAIDIAAGRVQTDDERAKAIAGKAKHAAMVSDYRQAAKIMSKELGKDVTGAQLQAVTWVYWRRNRIVKNHGDA